MEVPAVNLKAIVLVHWLLTTWGCMGTIWLPSSYTWGNFTVLAVGVWAIAQRDSIDAIIMFLIGLLLTVLTDIIHFSIFYPQYSSPNDLQRFSEGMAIFSLLLKPLSCLFVYQMYRERGGEYVINLELESSSNSYFTCDGVDSTAIPLVRRFFSVSRDRSAYQSIDQQDVPCPYPDLERKPDPHPY